MQFSICTLPIISNQVDLGAVSLCSMSGVNAALVALALCCGSGVIQFSGWALGSAASLLGGPHHAVTLEPPVILGDVHCPPTACHCTCDVLCPDDVRSGFTVAPPGGWGLWATLEAVVLVATWACVAQSFVCRGRRSEPVSTRALARPARATRKDTTLSELSFDGSNL